MADAEDVFHEVADGNREIDAYQLQQALNNSLTQDVEFEGFSDDLCRSMVAMHDDDLSGRLRFAEFKELWEDLHTWKETYLSHDQDSNGFFDKSEFAEVLEQIGLSVGDDILHALTIRFSDREGRVRFSDFVACAVKLKIAVTTFQQNSNGEDTAQFTTDQFIQLAMYT